MFNREFAYPFTVRKQGGEYIATFPDVSEAITGAKDRDQATVLARDALIAALGAYIEDKRDIPVPSPNKQGQQTAYLRPLEAAKLALYIAMREKNLTNLELAARLSIDEKAVRRMLDLDHPTKIDTLTQALRNVFSYRLITSMRKVPA